MKYLVISGIVLSSLFACSNPSVENNKSDLVDTSMEDAMLQKAVKRTDVATALVMANTILAKDSTRTGLYDTLFTFYYEMQNAPGLADVGLILLESKPNEMSYLEPTSAALSLMGEFDKAIELDRRMFAITGDLRIKVQIANNFAQAGNFADAKKEIQFIIDNKAAADTIKMEQPMPSMGGNKTQKVSLTAMSYLSLGQIALAEENKKEAVKQLNKAMAIQPNYDAAATMLLQLY